MTEPTQEDPMTAPAPNDAPEQIQFTVEEGLQAALGEATLQIENLTGRNTFLRALTNRLQRELQEASSALLEAATRIAELEYDPDGDESAIEKPKPRRTRRPATPKTD